MSRVGDIVHDRELFFAEESDTVSDVARHMAELQVGAILILNGQQLRGVFSERDLMKRVVVEGRPPDQTRVGQVMTTVVHTIDELATVADAMAAMQTHNYRHLPVVRGARVINFLSMRDVMNYELAQETEELDQMRAYISGSA